MPLNWVLGIMKQFLALVFVIASIFVVAEERHCEFDPAYSEFPEVAMAEHQFSEEAADQAIHDLSNMWNYFDTKDERLVKAWREGKITDEQELYRYSSPMIDRGFTISLSNDIAMLRGVLLKQRGAANGDYTEFCKFIENATWAD